MKKVIVLLILFVILTAFVVFCPVVTQWDKSIILFLQDKLAFLPVEIFMLPDCVLYSAMIAIPIIGLGGYFVRKKLYWDTAFICLVPLITYILNYVFKRIIRRPRPPFELQITNIHPDSFSFIEVLWCCGMITDKRYRPGVEILKVYSAVLAVPGGA